MKISAILLDFYGVLYSNFDWKVIDKRIYSDKEKAAEFVSLKRLSNEGRLSDDEFRDSVTKLANDEKHPNEPAVLSHPICNNHLIESIRQLLPDVKLALLSNGNQANIEALMKQGEIHSHFDLIATSSQTHLFKPQLVAFNYVYDKLGIEPKQGVLIDDSPTHVQGARSHGLTAIQYSENSTTIAELEKLLQKQ